MALISGTILDQTTGLPIQGVDITEVITPITVSPQEIINKLKSKKIKSTLNKLQPEKWIIIIPTFDIGGFLANITITSPTQKGEVETNIPGKVTVRTESLRDDKQNYFFEQDISNNVDIIVEFISQKYKSINTFSTNI